MSSCGSHTNTTHITYTHTHTQHNTDTLTQIRMHSRTHTTHTHTHMQTNTTHTHTRTLCFSLIYYIYTLKKTQKIWQVCFAAAGAKSDRRSAARYCVKGATDEGFIPCADVCRFGSVSIFHHELVDDFVLVDSLHGQSQAHHCRVGHKIPPKTWALHTGNKQNTCWRTLFPSQSWSTPTTAELTMNSLPSQSKRPKYMLVDSLHSQSWIHYHWADQEIPP